MCVIRESGNTGLGCSNRSGVLESDPGVAEQILRVMNSVLPE